MNLFCRSATKKPGNSSSYGRSFVIMIILLSCFMTTELFVGIAVTSLAMISDAFHLAGDVMALVIGLYADRAAKSSQAGPRATFGAMRAEVVGALVNGVFLLAICLFLVKEAGVEIHKVILGDSEEKTREQVIRIIIVGCVGFAVNAFGMCLFGHTHAHTHSHSHSHSHGHNARHDELESHSDEEDDEECGGGHSHSHSHKKHGHSHGMNKKKKEGKTPDTAPCGHSKEEAEGSVNTRAVYLHIMGDCLSSLAVIGSGVILLVSEDEWAKMADPLCSLISVGIIVKSTVPLLNQCVSVVMQHTPETVSFGALKADLEKLPFVSSVHELHIWELSTGRCIGTTHIRYRLLDRENNNNNDDHHSHQLSPGKDEIASPASLSPKPSLSSPLHHHHHDEEEGGREVDDLHGEALEEVQKVFHQHGIHETTIQFEKSFGDLAPTDRCDDLVCGKGLCKDLDSH